MTIILVVSIGASLLWASRWFHHSEDLGYVSAQWLSECRQNHES
jgi:hypothetical protein